MKVLLSLLALAALAAASPGGEREQLQEDYGFVEVRPGAHMFWVMYHVDQPGTNTDYPLIMWLQGGPGSSGVGYGNFMEMGPYDINGNLRDYAWTKKANLMFVDNPVGTGYSYVEDSSQLATDNAMIAADLVTLIKEVFTAHPDMQAMPFYVFAESYGGKMTVDFALAFDEAIKSGEVVSDFRGVALGDSWISPMDSVNTWGNFLYQMGFVNQKGLQAIDDAAANTQAAVDAGSWTEATNRWSYTELIVSVYANGVSFYNVLAEEDFYRTNKETSSTNHTFMSPAIRRLYDNHVAYQTRDALGDFMNGPQAESWGIPDGVVWDSQGSMVFSTLSGDFMKPVVDSVVRLLTETTLDVVVFTGDLDLICDTPGTYRWIENMEWPDKPNFMDADNTPIYITAYSSQAATIQKSGRFSLYTIFRSGHMVPIDAPEMSHKMLDMIFANSKVNKPKQETRKQEDAPKKETIKQGQQPAQVPPQHAVPIPVKLADLKEEAFKEEAEKEKEAPKPDKEIDSKKGNETEQKEHEKEEQKKQEKEHKQEKKQKTPKKEKTIGKHTKEEAKQKNEKQEQKKAPKLENIKEKVVKKVKEKQEKSPMQEQKQEEPKQEQKQKARKEEREKPKQEQKQKTPKQEKKEPKQEQKQKAPKEERERPNQEQKQKTPKQEKKEPKQEQKQKAHKEERENPKQEQKQKAPKQEKKEPKQEGKKGGPMKDVNKFKANIMAVRQQQQQQQQQRGHLSRHSPGPLPDARRMRR